MSRMAEIDAEVTELFLGGLRGHAELALLTAVALRARNLAERALVYVELSRRYDVQIAREQADHTTPLADILGDSWTDRLDEAFAAGYSAAMDDQALTAEVAK